MQIFKITPYSRQNLDFVKTNREKIFFAAPRFGVYSFSESEQLSKNLFKSFTVLIQKLWRFSLSSRNFTSWSSFSNFALDSFNFFVFSLDFLICASSICRCSAIFLIFSLCLSPWHREKRKLFFATSGRYIINEVFGLPKLINFLKQQEKRGQYFSRAMNASAPSEED